MVTATQRPNGRSTQPVVVSVLTPAEAAGAADEPVVDGSAGVAGAAEAPSGGIVTGGVVTGGTDVVELPAAGGAGARWCA